MAVKSGDTKYKNGYTKLITKSKGKVFVGAIKEYNTETGIVLPVCFNGDLAYIFYDEEGLYSTSEMESQIKTADKSKDIDFPHNYDCFIRLADLVNRAISPKLKERFGITSDIEADINVCLSELSDVTVERAAKLG